MQSITFYDFDFMIHFREIGVEYVNMTALSERNPFLRIDSGREITTNYCNRNMSQVSIIKQPERAETIYRNAIEAFCFRHLTTSKAIRVVKGQQSGPEAQSTI